MRDSSCDFHPLSYAEHKKDRMVEREREQWDRKRERVP